MRSLGPWGSVGMLVPIHWIKLHRIHRTSQWDITRSSCVKVKPADTQDQETWLIDYNLLACLNGMQKTVLVTSPQYASGLKKTPLPGYETGPVSIHRPTNHWHSFTCHLHCWLHGKSRDPMATAFVRIANILALNNPPSKLLPFVSFVSFFCSDFHSTVCCTQEGYEHESESFRSSRASNGANDQAEPSSRVWHYGITLTVSKCTEQSQPGMIFIEPVGKTNTNHDRKS